MRTLLHIYATFKVGGPQMRFAHLANHFGGAYRHVVVAMDGQTDAAARLAPGLNVELRTTPTTRDGGIWSNVKACRGLLDEVRPDLMVTSNWGSIEWALANLDARTPHLHMEDGFGPEEALRQLPRRVWTRRLALRRSMVLLPSMTLERMARNVWRLPQRRLIHTPNGVDCARFGVRPGDWMVARLIRLYPAYWAATLFAFALALMPIRPGLRPQSASPLLSPPQP